LRKRVHRAAGENTARKSVFVDSSAWIALFSARDQHHAECDQLFRQAVARRTLLLTTNLVLAEVHRLLLYRAGTRPAAAALGRIEASALVTLVFPGAADHRAARSWLATLQSERISYTDAVSFAVMCSSKCKCVMSFDRDFELAGFPFWRPDSRG